MDYSEALESVRRHCLIRRRGWNGQQQFVFIVPAQPVDPAGFPSLRGVFPGGTTVLHAPYLAMLTASRHIVPWTCPQSDALADDWEIVNTIVIDVSFGHTGDGKLHAGALDGKA